MTSGAYPVPARIGKKEWNTWSAYATSAGDIKRQKQRRVNNKISTSWSASKQQLNKVWNTYVSNKVKLLASNAAFTSLQFFHTRGNCRALGRAEEQKIAVFHTESLRKKYSHWESEKRRFAESQQSNTVYQENDLGLPRSSFLECQTIDILE